MSPQPVVQVEDLDVYYGTSQILFGVGLSVRPGETMALLGAATAPANRPR
jgi:branched-chain amino acid transport system ATP-binding protein